MPKLSKYSDTKSIENPFAIISYQIHLAINAPTILKLEKWLYQIDTLDAKTLKLPKGLYIVCGFGRMGKALYKTLGINNSPNTI